jgi:hypothetical protein
VEAKSNLFAVACKNQETRSWLNNKNVGQSTFSCLVLILQDKQLDRRFWKQLKRRRSGANAVLSPPPGVAA